MDLRSLVAVDILLLVLSCVFLQSMCDGGSTVLFLDGASHRYIRDQTSGGAQKIDTMTTSEIASMVSVLLGFAPSSSLSTESSAKLNEILVPNPFDKPLAALVLEVKGAGAPPSSIAQSDFVAVSSFNHKVLGSNSADIELSDEDDISVVSIDEPFSCVACLNKEFADLAHLLGGSYVGSMESMDGELNIPLASGSSLKLHVSKIQSKRRSNLQPERLSKLVFIKYNKALHERFQTRRLQNKSEDYDPIVIDDLNYSSEWMTGQPGACNEFVYEEDGLTWAEQADLSFSLGLASLVRGVKNAIQMHEDYSGSIKSPAELLSGVFTGIKVLKEDGPDAAEKGLEVLQTTIYNLFTLLQKEYKGKIVAVVVFSESSSMDSVSVFSPKYPTRFPRRLEEASVSKVLIPAVLLVRSSLAWITGIIFLVATLIGAYLLLNMPLTRDTLLYSNVKLD